MDMEIRNLNFENSINIEENCSDFLTTPPSDINLNSTYSLHPEKNMYKKRTRTSWAFLRKLKKEKLSQFVPQERYKGRYTKITFLHKSCNKTFEASPDNLFRRKNKCPHCSSDAFLSHMPMTDEALEKKNAIVQAKMDLIYNGEFKFIRINPKDKYTVELQHDKCKKTFIDYRTKLYTNKIVCPHCSDKGNKNNFISISEKIAMYEKRLNGKFKILESFTSQKEKIKLQRVSCGHTINRSLNDVLRKTYKDSCPECRRLKRLDDLNKKLDNKYNGRIKVINGIEKYQNNGSNLLFLDNKCGNSFMSSFTKLLSNELVDCPSCNIKTETTLLKDEVYNKYKGEYTVLGEYIDSKTPISFKHNKCNHVFFKTKDKFLQAKIPCKKCRNKSRSLGIKKAQEKVNKKFGNLFSLKGEYINSKSDLIVTCNNCNTIEELPLNKLLNRKRCLHCKSAYK